MLLTVPSLRLGGLFLLAALQSFLSGVSDMGGILATSTAVGAGLASAWERYIARGDRAVVSDAAASGGAAGFVIGLWVTAGLGIYTVLS